MSNRTSELVVDIASKIRTAMIDCLEEREGRYFATEAGCERIREILKEHGITANVKVGEDGKFQIGVSTAAHTCHWPRCGQAVPAAMWGCKGHWFTLPKHLRDRIWETYRRGQEITKSPSAEYIAAAKAVQEWIAQYQQNMRHHGSKAT